MQFLYLGALLQGLILILFVLGRARKTGGNIYLGVFLIVSCVSLFYSFLYCSEFIYQYPQLIGFNAPFLFLGGPLIFLYTSSFSDSGFRFKRWYLIHFIPFASLLVLTSFNTIPTHLKIASARSFMGGEAPAIYYGVQTLMIGLALFYAFFSLKKVKTVTGARQLRYFLWSIVFIYIIRAVVLVINASPYGDMTFLFGLIDVLVIALIYGLTYAWLKSSESLGAVTTGSTKYLESPLPAGESVNIYNRLSEHMRINKPYLNKGLTLSFLADQLQTNQKYLSQAINENINGNFSSYINRFRVEEFKLRVQDPGSDRFTILAIASECGFSSKSAFNTVFKRLTSTTPRQFLQQHRSIESVH